ncbi:MAG: hypothetical protein H6662_14030 [Ardenticatenaceae bacterium]|nr:hypothetical protein [Anaerolineales bacterium]MCB8922701.1 hypothetical protein [Ardenticatenaceae bacterium]MCB8991750.1 hypothetical protein [Ardenticatenaceae bacterium]MCB9003591.1 hypothetical protein [Ardenticatenaceae bacterium]
MNHPSKIRIWEPLLTLVLLGVAVVYMTNVFNTGNWLWFQGRATNVRPARIVVVDQGQRTVLTSGHAYFNVLADATEESLSKLGNTDLVGIGLSNQTLQDYASDSLVLELYFDEPIQFNTMSRVGTPTQLLIPIKGRHADGGYVFRGQNGDWWFGALRMADPTPLYDALTQMGYTAVPQRPINSG